MLLNGDIETFFIGFISLSIKDLIVYYLTIYIFIILIRKIFDNRFELNNFFILNDKFKLNTSSIFVLITIYFLFYLNQLILFIHTKIPESLFSIMPYYSNNPLASFLLLIFIYLIIIYLINNLMLYFFSKKYERDNLDVFERVKQETIKKSNGDILYQKKRLDMKSVEEQSYNLAKNNLQIQMIYLVNVIILMILTIEYFYYNILSGALMLLLSSYLYKIFKKNYTDNISKNFVSLETRMKSDFNHGRGLDRTFYKNIE